MTLKPITIAGVKYPTRTATNGRLQALLNAGAVDDVITGSADTALLSALFHAREEKLAALEGRKIIGWGREKTPARPCFAALLDTGEKLHFSYPNSLDALYATQLKAS